jgi:hypothetical protein
MSTKYLKSSHYQLIHLDSFIHTRTLFIMLATELLLGSLALGLVGALTTGPEARLAPISPRQSANCNTAANRTCWSDGFDILTDSETNWPGKGGAPPNEKFFNIFISEETLSPFGQSKPMLVVNGTYPGPTLIAGKKHNPQLPRKNITDNFLDWGDRLTINVTNNMKDNG